MVQRLYSWFVGECSCYPDCFCFFCVGANSLPAARLCAQIGYDVYNTQLCSVIICGRLVSHDFVRQRLILTRCNRMLQLNTREHLVTCLLKSTANVYHRMVHGQNILRACGYIPGKFASRCYLLCYTGYEFTEKKLGQGPLLAYIHILYVSSNCLIEF